MAMRTDRELLELAAKAAGLKVWRGTGRQAGMLFASPARPDPDGKVTGLEWNPFTDDGDALRLAVKLRLEVYIHERDTRAVGGNLDTAAEQHGTDAYAATRRAIVRAAAEIGAKMQKANHA